MKSSIALLACLVVLAAVGSAQAATTCLDENGNPVDWWYGPSLPKSRSMFRHFNSERVHRIILKAPYLHGSSATTSGTET